MIKWRVGVFKPKGDGSNAETLIIPLFLSYSPRVDNEFFTESDAIRQARITEHVPFILIKVHT